MRNKKSIFKAMLSGVLALTMLSACTTKIVMEMVRQ